MINAVPLLGWLLSFIGNASLAVPFWICWTVCDIGKTYFNFLPEQWQSIPFWNCVGLFMCMGLIRFVFTPKFMGTVSIPKGKD